MPAHRSTLAVLLLFGIASAPASAQTFTRITTGNPIVTSPVPRTSLYTGCAWVDFDDDGDQDFYIVQQGLFRNDGGGNFTRLTVIPPDHANAIGCSWADADNDGDPDLFVSGGPPGGSVLYVNQGNGTFARATNGAIGASALNQGWGCAWADWDLDGRVDLAISAAFGYLGITTSNHLLRNLGALDFESVDTSAVSARTAPYTIPTWNDVDLDGDPDLFIASGPAEG